MAKKTENFDFDDDLSFNFDDDFGEGSFQQSKRQTGPRKALAEFGGSFISGLKKSLLNPSNQRKFLDQNMPKGYAATFDAVSMGADGIRSIKDHTKKQFRDNLGDIQEDTETLNRVYGKFLPKRIREKLAEKIGENATTRYAPPSETDLLNESLDQIMSDMTQVQKDAAILQSETQKESTNKIVASQMANNNAVSISNLILSKVANNTDRLLGINSAHAKLQRKNTEITFKTYLTNRKILDTLQQTQVMQQRAFEAIIKNTALPEAVKITNWELTSRTLKQKMIGIATERVTARFGDIAGRMFDRVKENFGSTASNLGGQLGLMLSGLASAAQASEDGFGPSKASSRGSLAGSIAGDLGQFYLRKMFGDRFKNDPRFKKYGDMALNFMTSAPGNLERLNNNFGNARMLLSILGIDDIVAENSAKNVKVRGSGFKHLDEVTAFNRHSQMALTEVIPGWLGKIHHEIAIMRTGDASLDEQRYDYEKGGFITSKQLKGNITKSLFNKRAMNDSRARAHQTVNALDSKHQLSKRDRQVLLRYVLEQANSDTGFIDPRLLMSESSPLNKIDPKASRRIASVLANENNFNIDLDGNDYVAESDWDTLFGNVNKNANYQAKMRSANDRLKDTRTAMPMPIKQALQQARVGNIDILRDLGVVYWDSVNKENRFDQSKFIDAILGGGMSPGGGGKPPKGPRGGLGGNPFRPIPNPSAGSPGDQSSFGGGNDGGFSNNSPSRHYDDEPRNSNGLTTFQQTLIDTIERSSVAEHLNISNQLLEAIRGRLDVGIPQFSGEAPTQQQAERKANWFRRFILGPTVNGGKRFGRFMKFTNWTVPKTVIKHGFGIPLRILQGVAKIPSALGFGGGARVVNSGSREFKRLAGDLYIQGQDEPVIKQADLLAGKYFDEVTKKVIRRFKDIKGAILDADGNVVVSAEDVKNKLFTIANGKKFSVIGGTLRLFTNAVAGVFKLNVSSLKLATNVITKPVGFIARTAWNVLTAEKDIYVSGETSPRLLARVMRNGGYFNKDGTPIFRVGDIKSEVIDSSGDVILSLADMSKGLVDKYGKPLKSLSERLTSLITAPARLIGRGMVAGGRFAWKASIAPFKLLNKMGKFIYNKATATKDVDPKLQVTAHTATTVDNIYALLNERLAKPRGSWLDRDGSGFRDGSREDTLLNRSKNNNDGIPPPTAADDAGKDRKGILGMLMAIAGGIGGIIGTVKGWATNIFTLMKLTSQTRLLGSALDAFGGRGRGRGGRMLGGIKNFFTRSKVGRAVGLAAVTAGAIGLSRTSFAQNTLNGASSAIFGNDNQAYKDAISSAGMSGSTGSESTSSASNQSPQNITMTQRLMNGMGGSALGEIGAIASFPLLAMLYNKAKGTRTLGRFLPEMKHGAGAGTAPTSKMGKAWQFLSGTNKGRILLATLMGAGLVGGQHALTGSGGESLGDVTTSSYRNTLMLELGMATAAPWLVGKGKEWLDKRRGARTSAPTQPHFQPANATPHANVMRPAGQVPTTPRVPTPSPTLAPRAGIGGRLAGAGKGLFRNAGILGTGYALYDAATTEGTMWDKTKSFGTSLLTSAAIGKGLSLIGRQGLMAGARAGLVAGGSAIGAAIGWPVVLGGLALAGLGYGAWKGYKYFFGTDKNAIAKFRMAQYGFDFKDEMKITIIGKLEQLCQKNTTIDPSGKARFTKNVSAQEIFKLFSIDPKDKGTIQRFIGWFNGRFKPVFLQALAVYKTNTKSIDLEKADTLPKETKLQLINAMAAVPGTPYMVKDSPFPDGKPLKYGPEEVRGILANSVRTINHEKGKGDKSWSERVSDTMSSAWKSTKDFVMEKWDQTKELAGKAWDFAKQTGSALVDKLNAGSSAIVGGVKSAWNFGAQGMQSMIDGAGGLLSSAGDGISNFVAKMTGSQKDWQLRVYKAFKGAGFSEQQARILTAEIGRENSYNPKYLFGGHADPYKGSNLGMLSWQGDRKPRLISFLKQAGVLDKKGDIIPGQAALDAQAKFIMWELRNTHNKVGAKFLANPNISYKDGSYLIGKYYILWRIDDPKFAAQGKRNRDGFYNMLLKQLGATEGAKASPGMGTIGSMAAGTQPSTSLPNNPIAQAAARTNALASAPRLNNLATTGTSGYGGGTNLKTASSAGTISTSKDASGFIRSLDPKLIALGQKSVKVQSGVDLSGMVKGFMVIFYAMVGEAVQRGIVPYVQINSAYRSIEKQREVYNTFLRTGKPLAAKPGSSNHNFGIAIDINSAHANALAKNALLGKYGFHRPIKSEAWHIESIYFTRGKNTVKEVTKTIKEAANPAAVKKATAASVTNDPIAQEIAKAKKSNPLLNGVKLDSEEKLKRLSNGFMGQGDTIPTPQPSIERPAAILERNTGSKVSARAQTATAETMQKKQADLNTQMMDIQQQQLQVQTETLEVLKQIKSEIKGLGGKSTTDEGTDATPTPVNAAQQAANAFRGKAKDNIPVSMSIRSS